MKLSKCTHRNKVIVRKVESKNHSNRLESFGIYPGKKILNLGLMIHRYHLIISDDRILAVPLLICEEIEI